MGKKEGRRPAGSFLPSLNAPMSSRSQLRQCADADADAGSGMLRAPDRWRASIFPGSPFCGSHMFRPDDQSLSLQASH
jgi:hypothetical protein